ncbi:hypothetical protein FisN_11Hh295 [Fistulifera solaris]|jgi:hypothetical protein|uniref:Uncharacterized protein n=1 Tax=Fistulifera solaris TaxID=1519565 RepID=A0A1Z5JL55_FISSO|nr:hypothetical protein FisN_11Hh295 [Fistulifera solaris]|eukprot:GAX14750.1 hypothetical protein FisN_11Hh295 [Fistulifera solaris]
MKTANYLHRCGWIVFTAAFHHLIDSAKGDDINNTITTVEFEPALQCRNQSVYESQNFIALLGGNLLGTLTSSTEIRLPVPQDQPVGPSCGTVVPSGRGFWFPVELDTRGQVDVIFCTNTSSTTIVPIVYTAIRQATTSDCDDLYCVAEGITNTLPSSSVDTLRLEGTVCPDATSYAGVRFPATEGQVYFVYVDVTTAETELNNLQVTTMVTDLEVPNDHCSNSILLDASQPLITNDFVMVQMDLVPTCNINSTNTNLTAQEQSASRAWNNERKGVWFTLPTVENFMSDQNETVWDMDFCSTADGSPEFDMYIYEGRDCQNMKCFIGVTELCSFSIGLPNENDQVYHLFVSTNRDPAIGGSVTLTATPHGRIIATSDSGSANFFPGWGRMMNGEAPWLLLLLMFVVLQ